MFLFRISEPHCKPVYFLRSQGHNIKKISNHKVNQPCVEKSIPRKKLDFIEDIVEMSHIRGGGGGMAVCYFFLFRILVLLKVRTQQKRVKKYFPGYLYVSTYTYEIYLQTHMRSFVPQYAVEQLEDFLNLEFHE